ncbi:MAG: hypothetical protein KTV45_08530 [Acidimicrobiia bacterium]|nr:hypothetical protein [Acidimicrobiia bacterium]
MASLRTEITEIVTGLGMLPWGSIEEALRNRPAAMVGVSDNHYDRLFQALEDPSNRRLFEKAWANGKAFARAEEGLRGRPPLRVEWKGPHQLPGYEQIPVDLRVDYVYLVSCKYGSKLLHNVSPSHLFDRLLAVRQGKRTNWYNEVAPLAYQQFYTACRDHLTDTDLPEKVTDLHRDHRNLLKQSFKRRWPAPLAGPYGEFTIQVSQASAQRWNASLGNRLGMKEELLWRLLRFQPAPYFVLGTLRNTAVRYRVDTPWDFRQRYDFRSFDIEPEQAGQPKVGWQAELREKATGNLLQVQGHMEVRWSHGRFQGAPEAKIYLDSSPFQTAGYTPLT